MGAVMIAAVPYHQGVSRFDRFRLDRLRVHRERVRRHPVLRPAYRTAVFLTGVVVLVTGVVLLVLPGPGWLLIFLALAILATEFAWAQRLLTAAKGKYSQVRARTRRRPNPTGPDDPAGAQPVR